jgi:hypothetical protein
MAVDISNLRIELLTGSHASLYSATILAGNYNGLMALLYSVSSPPTTVTIGIAQAITLQQQVVASEYLALTAAQRELWNAVLTVATGQGIAISNTLIRTQMGAVWSAATTTRSNLSNIQTRTCTRIEELAGEGAKTDINTVYYAVNGTF